jgi:2-polyprenyl-3-methyl-5-hydroxy-6-metoxy-1,4-benzoquinol methylase
LATAAAPIYRLKHFKYSSHDRILKIIDALGGKLNILDVGCADGYLGALLRERGHYLAGVEQLDTLAAQAQAHYDRFHHADLESFEFPFREEFDVILFADVLEHLRNPQAVLQRALPALRPQGRVIVSVPNVANIVVRLNLLFGRFNYTDRGILDRTHLRFFTLATLRQFMESCRLRIIEVAPTPIPVQLVIGALDAKPFAPLHALHFLAVQAFKRLLAFQFVVTARKN